MYNLCPCKANLFQFYENIRVYSIIRQIKICLFILVNFVLQIILRDNQHLDACSLSEASFLRAFVFPFVANVGIFDVISDHV